MSAPQPLGQDTSLRVRRGFFLVLLLIVTMAFFGLIRQFLSACFWAAILAIIFSNTHDWFMKRTRDRTNVSAALTVTFILLVVIVPVTVLSFVIVDESIVIYEEIKSGDLNPQKMIERAQQQIPVIEDWIERVSGISAQEQTERLANIGSSVIQSIGKAALKSSENILRLFIEFTLMLYILFFFIRDGDDIVDAIKRALPIGDNIEERLFRRFTIVSRATIKGTLVVAVVQGGLGGIVFAILGIPAATLWGVVMVLLSLLPAIGSSIVWFPAAVILFIGGEYTKAIILVIAGVFLIGLVDNLLRPRLVSRDTKMPDYLILLATLGGLASFGLSGFIIGPVLAALFVTCWQITGELFGGKVK